jgi:hypothetical protein
MHTYLMNLLRPINLKSNLTCALIAVQRRVVEFPERDRSSATHGVAEVCVDANGVCAVYMSVCMCVIMCL